jgi:hypothetical protein
MAASQFPLLIAPPRVQVSPPPIPVPQGGGSIKSPKKGRQAERLEPQFNELRQARNGLLQSDAAGASPEQVLVFDVVGSTSEVVEAFRSAPGLHLIADEDLDGIAPDEDFYNSKKPRKLLKDRLYLVMFSQAALEQLLSTWDLWSKKRHRKLPDIVRPWVPVFRLLRGVRRWSAQDRIAETGLAEDWEARKASGQQSVPVEIQLWFRANADRIVAEDRVRSLVANVGGRVVGASCIEEIAYHAVLARLPADAVARLLSEHSIELVKSDDVHLFRPVPQVRITADTGSPVEQVRAEGSSVLDGEPIAALLDGLPLENHTLLKGHLVVEDPDDWSETYAVQHRRHGTAMASLIVHGDLNRREPALARPLYVRPILRPDSCPLPEERAPEDVLFVDVVHRAVRRIAEGEAGEPPAAPSVKIVNLSVGDEYQPFVRSVSPLARLIDWLSWKYQLLFIISAGNWRARYEFSGAELRSDGAVQKACLSSVRENHRLRRLLSPAEAINALTVGAAHEDAASSWQPRMTGDRTLIAGSGLPAPYSALGRGFRRSVKPDVLAPGGRAVFTRAASKPMAIYEESHQPLFPPGQKHAAPSPLQGVNAGVWYTHGTSNAAALTTRAACQIFDALQSLPAEQWIPELADVPAALWVKALLVHTAQWDRGAVAALQDAIPFPNGQARDELTAFLGYGQVRPQRALACASERATLLAGGSVGVGEAFTHRVPVPPCLHTFARWRRLTATLAWFTPINPGHRKYRRAALSFDAPTGPGSVLLVDRTQVHGLAVSRGTVQHDVLERDDSVIAAGDDSAVEIRVRCTEDAGFVFDRIPYALAVSLEVSPDVQLPVYEQVRQAVKQAIAVTQRS